MNSAEGTERVMGGVGLIQAERQRQIDVEGWSPEHDDEHDLSEMADAAICYAEQAASQASDGNHNAGIIPNPWPWHKSWWKPSDDPVRNLVKAGALIAAEIDRLQRKAEAKS